MKLKTFSVFGQIPASNKMYVEIKHDGTQGFNAELINATGQVVKSSIQLQSGINEIQIDNYPSWNVLF